MGSVPAATGSKTRPFVILLALVPVLVCCGLCGVLGLWLNFTTEKEAMDKAKRDIADLKPELSRTYAAVPLLSELRLAPCPDVEIKDRYRAEVTRGMQGEARLWISAVPYEVLGTWLRGGPRPEEPSDWSWMADSPLLDIMDPARYDLPRPGENIQSFVRSLRRQRYLGVLRSSSKAMPRVTGEGARLDLQGRRLALEKGKSFDAGFFHGWLVVMDMDAASPVCHVPIDVENSPTLTYRAYGVLSQKPTDVATHDFKDRFRTASHDALANISTLLSLSP